MALGEILRKTRTDQGLTASEVAKAILTKVQIVEAIEEERFDIFSASIYAKGFIKHYAEHLGLDARPMIEEYLATLPKKRKGAPISELANNRQRVDASVSEEMETPASEAARRGRRKPIFGLLAGKTLDESDPAGICAERHAAETQARKHREGHRGVRDASSLLPPQRLEQRDVGHEVEPDEDSVVSPPNHFVELDFGTRDVPCPPEPGRTVWSRERIRAAARRLLTAFIEDRRVLAGAVLLAMLVFVVTVFRRCGGDDGRVHEEGEQVPAVGAGVFETVIPPPEPYVD